MKEAESKRDFGLVLVLLRAVLAWNRATLAQKAGVDEGLLAEYERGLRRPLRKTRERLAKAFGVEASFLAELVPLCRSCRLAYESARRGQRSSALPVAEIVQSLEGKVAGSILETLEPLLPDLARLDDAPAPRAEDRAWAEDQWAALKPQPAESQSKILHAFLGDERSWALAVRLCEASEAAAADNAAQALRLAQLAATLAAAAPGPEPWRHRLRGFCEPFVGNALRVAGTLAAAREGFARADTLWAQGEGGDPAGLLDGTRRLDLKASLLRQDGQFTEALHLLDQALEAATPEATARLLIKIAATHTRAGDYQKALEILQQVEPRVDPRLHPRLPWVLQLNRGVNYCHLDRYQEAESLLPRVEELAAELNTKLDGIRTLWLRGKTWAGLGRREEALTALADVRRHFLKEQIAYDYALVSLELATLQLEQGRTRQVKEIAEEMLWIFKGEKVHKEALAALTLFREAARREKVGAGWTRRMVKYLYRAQHNPKLRFEG